MPAPVPELAPLPAAATAAPGRGSGHALGSFEGLQKEDGSLRLNFLYSEPHDPLHQASAGGRRSGSRSTAVGLLDEHGEVDLRAMKRSERPRASSANSSSVAPAGWPPAAAQDPRASQAGPSWAPWDSMQARPEGVERGPEPEVQGPAYSQWIWAYYSNSGAWSDGLCVGLQNVNLLAVLFCPLMWLRRLYLTLQRAAPLDVRILGSTCRVTQETACRVASAASFLLLLGCSLGSALCLWLLLRLDHEHPVQATVALAILPPSWLLGTLLWAQLLVAVGQKYNVTQVQLRPLGFLLKASGCLCAMNLRVGLHVDRAHGFLKPSRAVRDMVQLAASMGYSPFDGRTATAEVDQGDSRLQVV